CGGRLEHALRLAVIVSGSDHKRRASEVRRQPCPALERYRAAWRIGTQCFQFRAGVISGIDGDQRTCGQKEFRFPCRSLAAADNDDVLSREPEEDRQCSEWLHATRASWLRYPLGQGAQRSNLFRGVWSRLHQ